VAAVADPTTPAAPPTSVAAPTTAAAPVVELRTIKQTVSIPYPRTTVNDPNLPKGTTKIRTRGVAGSKTVTYEVTLTNGVETARRVVSDVVTKQPVTEVTAVGTKSTQQCDPNYTPCVPIASDVDCAGGSGNGPAYVEGPVYVIGTDIYDLDGNDNDGIGCES
jgi:resuscitation-promoting factor RpfB